MLSSLAHMRIGYGCHEGYDEKARKQCNGFNPIQSSPFFFFWAGRKKKQAKIANTATIIVVKVSYEIVMMVKLMSTLKGGYGSLCEKYNTMNQPHIHMPKTPWHI